ncbi:MAG: hypothetical protein K0S71_561 [Clostridia bacterium]|jgi:hypothetical protein|nr:hypothetical protein [Clostridia bacterium]
MRVIEAAKGEKDMNIYIIKGSDIYDVTKLSSGISWSYDLDTLAATLSVSVSSGIFGVGDKIILKHGSREVYRGVIVGESGRHTKGFSCMDLGWYLNKNEVIVQFKKSTVYDAIIHLCNKFSIPVELPANLKIVKVTKIYKDVGVGDILKELLEMATLTTNNKYYMRMFGKVLAVRTFHREPIKISGVGLDYSLGRSIEDMSNKIIIVSSEENNKRVFAEAKDDKSIKNFGLLQTIESAEAEDVSKAKNIAKLKLKELNKITEDISFPCLGNFDIVAGRRVIVSNPELKGEYLVKGVTHNYKNDNNYFCDLTVERWGV